MPDFDMNTVLAGFLKDLQAGTLGPTWPITAIRVGDGSASAPSYSFANDTNSGVYSGGADNLRVSLGGTQYQGWFVDEFQLRSSTILGWSGGAVGAASDVSLSRGAANRLDLATGDSYYIVSGSIGVGVVPGGTGEVSASSVITAASGTATPAGGSTSVGIRIGSAVVGVYIGTGAPTISAAKGSLYIRTDATTTTTRLYINTDGGTTWTNFTTAA